MSSQQYENLQIDDSTHNAMDSPGRAGTVTNATYMESSTRNWIILFICFGVVVTGVNLSISIYASLNAPLVVYTTTDVVSARHFSATNIAFGSCSSYDLRQMPIWTEAIIPSEPDVWIWSGDMVYLDDNEVNCAIFESTVEWQQSCNCTSTWLERPPYTCHAGDAEYANQRWITALNNEQYNSFLDYMCPKARGLGIFPPPGSDPAVCDRGIFGIYDDHDFGANNGNRREPDKREFKSMYLDAIGEPAGSPRRGANRGAWGKVTLNEGSPGLEVDIFLLDERYERENIPCDTRRDYCEYVVLGDTTGKYAHERIWCTDFLHSGLDGSGSCCAKDEVIFDGWCNAPGNKEHHWYRYACDVTFEHFGQTSLVLNAAGDLVEPNGSEVGDVYQDSPFCEVLGKAQRRWLRKAVSESKAPVKLFVSGSVLLYNPLSYTCGSYVNETTGQSTPVSCRCGGDNMDCYSVAQRELLHIIANSSGCPVVVTGDYHFADLKALLPGRQLYSNYSIYNSQYNTQTVYQVMSSGMSESTARMVTCEDYRLDPLGLRTHPECDFVVGPNFGRVLLETSPKGTIERLRLQVLSGKVADTVLLETIVDTSTCNPN